MISNHFLYKDLVHHPIDSQPFINGWPWGSRLVYIAQVKTLHPGNSSQIKHLRTVRFRDGWASPQNCSRCQRYLTIKMCLNSSYHRSFQWNMNNMTLQIAFRNTFCAVDGTYFTLRKIWCWKSHKWGHGWRAGVVAHSKTMLVCDDPRRWNLSISVVFDEFPHPQWVPVRRRKIDVFAAATSAYQKKRRAGSLHGLDGRKDLHLHPVAAGLHPQRPFGSSWCWWLCVGIVWEMWGNIKTVRTARRFHQVVQKHSTRCGILQSTYALFESYKVFREPPPMLPPQ